jgi:hypothetical protein
VTDFHPCNPWRRLSLTGGGAGPSKPVTASGELLLFLLMERLLGLPQLLAKMSLKTSGNVHVHGSDGVHASLGDDGILDVYWGESKLYKSSSDAFSDCFESIAPLLIAGGVAVEAQRGCSTGDAPQPTQHNEELVLLLLRVFPAGSWFSS